MTDPVYVTTGAWGSGTGAPLPAATIDENFYRLVQRIETLEDDPPIGPYLTSISLAGTSFSMGLSDGSTLGPITFTIPMPSWRGDWAPATSYQGLNFFNAPDGSLGAVMVAHTSAGTFDWAADDGSGNLLYRSISGSATGAFSGLSDVTITSPSTGQVPVYNSGSGKWLNDFLGVNYIAEMDLTLTDPAIGTAVVWDGDHLVSGYTEESFIAVIDDETTSITTGTAKFTFRVPRARTLNEIRASLATASGSGAVQVDVNKNGSSILSTKLTIDATEKTSVTAATPVVIADEIFADDDEVTIDIDNAGSSAKGLKVTFFWTRN